MMDTTTTCSAAPATLAPEWSTSKTIALAVREGATLASDEAGRFILTKGGETIARGATLQELALALTLVRKRRPRAPWITVKLTPAILDGLGALLDRGETMSALIRSATAAEVQRRRAEHELLMNGAEPAGDHDNERAALLLRLAELQRALELPR